jgi:nucleoside-diphosphate-sugar epimerase
MLYNDEKSISIIGCGWLGLPLAKFLLQKGFFVKGSTTHSEKLNSLEIEGIVPYLVQLNPALSGNNLDSFFASDLLIVNIPPGRKSLVDDYVQKIQNLHTAIKSSLIKKVIFISSTSVYPNNNHLVNEDSEKDNSAGAVRMCSAEEVFRNDDTLQTTIIRMSGLFGPDRHPGRFFGDKKDIPNGLAPINLIHLEDCIGLIYEVINQNFWNKTINGVAPSHPQKQDFYELASMKYNGSKISFIPKKDDFKIVESKIVGYELPYQFKYPNLMQSLNRI